MKRSTKIGLGAVTLLLGAVILSGCTASFCSTTDKTHILYAMDYGVTDYIERDSSDSETTPITITWKGTDYTVESVRANASFDFGSDIVFSSSSSSVISTITSSGIKSPALAYWAELDSVVLNYAVTQAYEDQNNGTSKLSWTLPEDPSTLTALQIRRPFVEYEKYEKGILDVYGYLKFYGTDYEKDNEVVLWGNQDLWQNSIREKIGPDFCPTSDFTKLYRSTMQNKIASYRSCLAIDEGDYGAYGDYKLPVEMESKAWTDWNGLLEFLFVWPIGALINVFNNLFAGLGNGVSQLFAIFFVTIIVRSLMLIVTLNQQKSTAKMNELQPEIQKIQAKYPNANTNSYEKNRMAMEMQTLYKKNKVNPLTSILVMIVQFPVFICVWGAMQGSAALSSGQFLNLRLSDSISSVLFNSAEWGSGGAAPTALVLFLLMSGAQVVSMLLPQWIQKHKAKNVAKLGKNPAQKQQNGRMKIFTYVMMGMIIFMGFSLASGMGVYWFVGALFSIAQTLITQAVTSSKTKKKKGHR